MTDVFVPVGSSSRPVLEAIGALDADVVGEAPGVLHLFALDVPGSETTCTDICEKLDRERWPNVRLNPIPPDLQNGIGVLVNSLAGAQSDDIVLLPASGTDLDALLVAVCERAEILVMKALPSAPVQIETVLDPHSASGSHAAAVEGALEEWRFLPRVAQLDWLDLTHGWVNPDGAEQVEAQEVKKTLDAMCKRTRHWVKGDVWQADLLPHMLHHGQRHGQRVDRIATDLLLLSPLFESMSGSERLSAVEALSAAAWLHDVGQQGGSLDGVYFHDYEHVRKFHGVLTCETMTGPEGAGDYDLRDDELRFLVAQLCKCHQRTARLDSETPKPLGTCSNGCKACEVALSRLMSSLSEEVGRRPARRVQREHAVPLGAILRIADACDIGVHRVNGRWTAGALGVEQVWRRQFALVQLLKYWSELNPVEQEALDRLTTLGKWDEADLLTLENTKAEVGKIAASKVRAFDSYLLEQLGHVEKHKLFNSSRIASINDDGFAVHLLEGPDWGEAGNKDRIERTKQAFRYIWGEYRHSERYFKTDHLPELKKVVGPDGYSWDREMADEG